MKKYFSKKLIILYIILIIIFSYLILSYSSKVQNPEYGVSFNTLYAKELGLNWKEVYDSLINDLNVKKFRLAAHWDMVEPKDGQYNFSELDYQLNRAEKLNLEVIFALGKRLPRWPECHIPSWATNLQKEESEAKILRYIETVINRYKNYNSISTWQVENEAFLSVYATSHCFDFDQDFLLKEIELVKKLDDKKRPILITDSGELSTWRKAFSMGDIFGTTVYVYSWNKVIGDFRNPFLPGFYSLRSNIWNLFGDKKESIIAELALEPWLDKLIVDEKTEIQIERMSPKKFNTVIEFAKNTGMKKQYLWGAEWWYYMKIQGNDWYWNRAKELFSDR